MESDKYWIKQSFLLPAHAIDSDYDSIYRVYSTSRAKYTDTSFGGSWEINPLPGFTENADLVTKGSYDEGFGIGRGYSELFDDNKVLAHFQVGVPRFNSLTRYFGDFYSVEAASLARTGRARSGFMYAAGSAAGTLLTIPLMPVLFIAKVGRFILGRPSSKFYTLKPTMHAYWSSYSTMVNGIWAGMGVHEMWKVEQRQPLIDPGEANFDEDWTAFHKILPDVFGKGGYIDMMAVSTKAERLAIKYKESLEAKLTEGMSSKEMMRTIHDLASDQKERRIQLNSTRDLDSTHTLENYLKFYFAGVEGEYADGNAAVDDATAAGLAQVADRLPDEEQRDGWFTRFAEAGEATAAMGADFISFRINNPGTQSESFSNQTKESGIASTINSMSASARDTRFNIADGNLDSAGIASTIVNGVRDFAMGAAKTFSVEGIAALAGSAFADIPEQWDSSSSDMNKVSFTIPLRSPSAHPVARLQNIISPICAMVSMTAALSTGPQSYTSPFLVSCFIRGRAFIRLGIIDSISIERGDGDVGWTNKGEFLSATMTVTVKDLSTVCHMPILTKSDMSGVGFLGKDAADVLAALSSNTYSEDSMYSDYINTLAAVPLEDVINKTSAWSLRRRRRALASLQWSSPSYLASASMNGMFGDLFKSISIRTQRQ